MADTSPGITLEITQDDRTMAILSHVLQLVGWWIAPLIIFLLKRGSRFVSRAAGIAASDRVHDPHGRLNGFVVCPFHSGRGPRTPE
jgi:hypothetical protein